MISYNLIVRMYYLIQTRRMISLLNQLISYADGWKKKKTLTFDRIIETITNLRQEGDRA